MDYTRDFVTCPAAMQASIFWNNTYWRDYYWKDICTSYNKIIFGLIFRVGQGRVLKVFSVTQLVDWCKFCILIGYSAGQSSSSDICWFFFHQFQNNYFVNLHLLTWLLLCCPSCWMILKQLDPLPSRVTGQ